MTALVLDTHALLWWATEPERVSERAAGALRAADELVVAPVTWWELAWLATHGRVIIGVPVATWLSRLAREVRTVALSPSIAAAASALPSRSRATPPIA